MFRKNEDYPKIHCTDKWIFRIHKETRENNKIYFLSCYNNWQKVLETGFYRVWRSLAFGFESHTKIKNCSLLTFCNQKFLIGGDHSFHIIFVTYLMLSIQTAVFNTFLAISFSFINSNFTSQSQSHLSRTIFFLCYLYADDQVRF